MIFLREVLCQYTNCSFVSTSRKSVRILSKTRHNRSHIPPNSIITNIPSLDITYYCQLLTASLYIYLLTYLLTPWCIVLLEKLTGLQLVKKFPEFHGTRRFITTLASVRHLSLSRASPIQAIYPHPTSWRSILILSTHLRLGLPSGLFPSGFPTQDPTQLPLLTRTRHMPRPSRSSRFYHPHKFGRGVQII